MLYRGVAPWWPDADFERKFIVPEQDARYEADAWEDVIAEWLRENRKTRTTIHEIARQAIIINTDRLGTGDQRRIAAALRRLEWSEHHVGRNRWWAPITDRYGAVATR